MLSILELPTFSVKVIIIPQASSSLETTIVYDKSSTGSGRNWWQCEQSNEHHSCTGQCCNTIQSKLNTARAATWAYLYSNWKSEWFYIQAVPTGEMAGYVPRRVSIKQSMSFYLVVTSTGKIEYQLYARVTPYSEFGNLITLCILYHLDLHRRK